MYISAKDFTAYTLGKIKKGQELPFNKVWLDAGLIVEAETKPEAKPELETKPQKQKKKTK
jgi:hypothetical protein